MKRLVLLLLALPLSILALNAQDVKIVDKYVFHQLTFLDAKTDKVIDESIAIKGMIISGFENQIEYLTIYVADVHTFNLRIVKEVIDYPSDNLKVIMKQGGEKIEGQGIYTANVFFIYDLKKNTGTPDAVRFCLNGSPNIMVFEGLIRLKD